MRHSPAGNTFDTLNIEISKLDKTNPEKFATDLRAAVVKLKNDDLNFFVGQMRKRTSVANRLPFWAAVFAVIGVLFSALGAVVRALSLAKVFPWEAGDVVMLSIAVVAYALMSVLIVFERLTEGSGGYFRAASTVVAIRDLWSEYHFADIGRALAPRLKGDDEEIQRWLQPAQQFCKSLDGIVSAEMTQWQTAYQATAKLRSDTADAGLKAAISELKLSADAAAASAKEAAKKADDATKAAEEAAQEAKKAAANAAALATLNLTLATSNTPGEAIIKLDGIQVAKASNQLTFSFPRLKQGDHHIHVDLTPVDTAKPSVSFEKSVDLKAGINAETIP